jgi:tetratricopeptide (TPR) repeat protein
MDMKRHAAPMALCLGLLAGCGGGLTPFEGSSGYDQLIRDGWIEYNSFRFESAQALFGQAIAAAPSRPQGYIGDGWSLLKRQKPDSALEVFFEGFKYARTSEDSLDTVCGVTGAYLARGENTRVIAYLDQFDLDRLEIAFPLENHDFFLDRGDLELACALAFYRLRIYSDEEGPDPNNAVFHLNQALPAPVTYNGPENLMERMVEYYNQSPGIPYK